MNRKKLISIIFLIAVLFWFAAGAGAAAITERGRLLAEYDAAAWHATDAVLATHPKEGSSNRYISHKTETGWVVDFGKLSATGDRFLVVSEAIQSGGQYTVRSFDPAREDVGWNLAAAKGIETAMRDFHGRTVPSVYFKRRTGACTFTFWGIQIDPLPTIKTKSLEMASSNLVISK
jgi:hypothetical protein